jgi:AraC-like DNA-binding protein
MVTELIKGGTCALARPPHSNRTADRIRECIHDTEGGLDLARLAKEVGLSPFQVVRAFKRRFGVPPHVYQLTVRIARARRLLLQGVATADVAAECGFVDQSHLSRHFKQHVGVTPVAYAKASAAARHVTTYAP